MSKKRHNKTFGNLIIWVMIGIAALTMLIGFTSCNVTKQKHYEHKKSDTAASWDERVTEILNSHELADSSIYTDADTLTGSVDLSDTTTVLESDNQKIEIIGIAGVKGKYKVRATAKPKKVDFKIQKSTTQITNSNKTGELKASHNDKVAVKEKKTSYKWYVFAAIALVILLVLWWAYTKIKKYRNITKDTLGV
jgi:cytochrome oxidase assembly protein ShyY1